ncbi:MAG: alpha/beta fold hydrolase [Rhodopseudomonas sp.]|nr:alpha/beta fold hydrolase [Rhodopseudomonas sp.]
MNLELISIETDTYPLDGIFYRPRNLPVRAVAMFLHGNCHNFYMGPSRFMPETLLAEGIACLAFNRRGHDMVTSLDGRNIGGGSFQLAHEAIADSGYAAAWLRDRGFVNPIVIGHSNGGVLAAQYAAEHPEAPAVVLMSAHRGGAGITELMSGKGLFGRDRLPEVKAQAERMVAEGRGRELMLLPGWWWVASAECVLDYAANMPDTLVNAARIKAPVLYLCGDQEPADLYPLEKFASLCTSPCETHILANCDHFYTGHEAAVSRLVTDWLVRTCGLST